MNKIKTNERIISIDRLRGLTLILMVFVNFPDGIEWIPAWMKHADPYGLTFADFIAPCFFFIIGLTFYISYNKRCEKGSREDTTGHFIIRGLAIIGVGSLLSSFEMIVYGEFDFDIQIQRKAIYLFCGSSNIYSCSRCYKYMDTNLFPGGDNEFQHDNNRSKFIFFYDNVFIF
jgi:hypothetical protein